MDRPAVRVSAIPWPVIRTVGLVVPVMREVAEMRHQFDQPFIIDSSATTRAFGLTATPWDEVVRATVAGMPVTA
jgi:hypothetical protein